MEILTLKVIAHAKSKYCFIWLGVFCTQKNIVPSSFRAKYLIELYYIEFQIM